MNLNNIIASILSRIFKRKTLEKAESLAYNSYMADGVAEFTFREKEKKQMVKTYYEVSSLKEIMNEYDVSREVTAEVGAAYGRKSCWIHKGSEIHYAIEPSTSAYQSGKDYFPEIKWVNNTAQKFELDQKADFIFTWTVLQHVPDTEIEAAVENIVSHLDEGGYLLIAEDVHGGPTETYYPRSEENYIQILSELEFIDSREREIGLDRDDGAGRLMVFRK